MDLKEVLFRNPDFRIAQSSDNECLMTAIERSPMKLHGLDLIYDRRPSFQKLQSLQGSHFFTTLAQQDERISTMASFAWSSKWVNQKKATVVYVGDFRSEQRLKASRAWRALYRDLIEYFHTDPEIEQPCYLLTAILRSNQGAFNSLVKNKKGKAFFYHPLTQLTMVNVFGRKPLSRLLFSSNHSDFRFQQNTEDTALRYFLNETHKKMHLGSSFGTESGNEWDRRKTSWSGFELKNFLVLVDSNNQIAACTLPWSPKEAKRMRIVHASRFLTWGLTTLLKLGFSIPQVGEDIETLYLTHLTFSEKLSGSERAQCVAQFLHFIFENNTDSSFHMISFSDSEFLRKESSLKMFFTQTTDVDLYFVSDQETPPEMAPDTTVEFEMALV